MLRRFRRTSGLSQAALARRAGLSREAIALLEENLRTPEPTTLALLADALALEPEDRDLLFDAPSSRLTPPYGVPRYPDRFFGRPAELDELARHLAPGGARLITLTGPGGVGKTRLAAAVTGHPGAAQTTSWLRLTPDISEPEFVAELGAALAVPVASRTSLESIVQGLTSPPQVLVLDQADALTSVASACDTLLERTPLRMVVTSRQRLHLRAEVVIPVAPLPAPAVAADHIIELTSEATMLFTDRSDAGPRTTPAPPHQAPARLQETDAEDQSLQLRSRADDAGPNAGLTAHLVGDSYPVLGAGEQQLLGRLSVFSGRFDLVAVMALYGSSPNPNPGHVLSALAARVSRSLVLRHDDLAGHAKFSLLQVVGEFATERLDEASDAHEIRRRHADYFRDLARGSVGTRDLPRPHVAAARLEAHAGNLRRAFAWHLGHRPESALSMVASLWPWWQAGGYYGEGRSSAVSALETNPSAAAHLKAPAFAAAGMFALLQSDYEDAQWHIQQGLDAYSAVGDSAGVSWTLGLLGALGRERGEYTVADQLHSQALLLARRADDPHAIGAQLNALSQVSWLRGDLAAAEDRGQRALESSSALDDQEGVIWALINLGATARVRGDRVSASVFLVRSLELSEGANFREGVAWSLNQLGVLARLEGNVSTALTRQTLSLREHCRLGNRWRTASVHDELAALAAADHDGHRAVAHLAAADQLRREIRVPLPRVEQPERDETVRVTQSLLGTSFRASTLSGMDARSTADSSPYGLSVGAC